MRVRRGFVATVLLAMVSPSRAVRGATDERDEASEKVHGGIAQKAEPFQDGASLVALAAAGGAGWPKVPDDNDGSATQEVAYKPVHERQPSALEQDLENGDPDPVYVKKCTPPAAGFSPKECTSKAADPNTAHDDVVACFESLKLYREYILCLRDASEDTNKNYASSYDMEQKRIDLLLESHFSDMFEEEQAKTGKHFEDGMQEVSKHVDLFLNGVGAKGAAGAAPGAEAAAVAGSMPTSEAMAEEEDLTEAEPTAETQAKVEIYEEDQLDDEENSVEDSTLDPETEAIADQTESQGDVVDIDPKTGLAAKEISAETDGPPLDKFRNPLTLEDFLQLDVDSTFTCDRHQWENGKKNASHLETGKSPGICWVWPEQMRCSRIGKTKCKEKESRDMGCVVRKVKEQKGQFQTGSRCVHKEYPHWVPRELLRCNGTPDGEVCNMTKIFEERASDQFFSEVFEESKIEYKKRLGDRCMQRKTDGIPYPEGWCPEE